MLLREKYRSARRMRYKQYIDMLPPPPVHTVATGDVQQAAAEADAVLCAESIPPTLLPLLGTQDMVREGVREGVWEGVREGVRKGSGTHGWPVHGWLLLLGTLSPRDMGTRGPQADALIVPPKPHRWRWS